MNFGFRHGAAVLVSLLLLVSLASAGWEQVNSGTTACLTSVHFPEGTQVGYAVGGVNESLGGFSVVVKTTDGGATWQTHNLEFFGMLSSVYFRDNNNGYAVGDMGKAIRTSDGGAIWETMAVPDSGALNGIQFPENGQIGYIGLRPQDGGSRLLKTTDGGDSWMSIILGWPTTSRNCRFATDNIGIVVGDSGPVMATTDGGGTFAAQGPQTLARLVAAAFSPYDPNRGYLIGNGTTQGVVRYTATFGDPLWEIVQVDTVAAFYGVDMPTNNVAYICGTDGFIGKTLTPTNIQNTDVPSGITATMTGLCFPSGADTGFAVGTGGVILRTYNGGEYGGVADTRVPAARRAGIRVLSNPSRRGFILRADADVNLTAFNATGRTVASKTATKGLDFLPLSNAGVYIVEVEISGRRTTQKVVIGR